MRIGGEAPGGGSILESGMEAMACCGSPPPRIVIGSSSYEATSAEPLAIGNLFDLGSL
jgi:hypothetical protein